MADDPSKIDPVADEWARANRSGALRRARVRRAMLIGALPMIASLAIGLGFISWDYLKKAEVGAPCDEKPGCRGGSCLSVGGDRLCIEDCTDGEKCGEGFTCTKVEVVSIAIADLINDPLHPKERSHGTRYKCVPNAAADKMNRR